MRADPAVIELHKTIDAFMRRILAQASTEGFPTTCPGKGCSACCYEPVLTDRREIEHALGRLTPEARKRVKERTKEWLAKVVPSGLLNQNLPLVFSWRKLRAPCPFLEIDEPSSAVLGYAAGRCSIYADRPAACRYHQVCGPRERCYDDALRPVQTFIESPDFMAQAVEWYKEVFGEMDGDHLGVFLADILLHEQIPSAATRKITKHQVHLLRTRGKLKPEEAAAALPD